MEMKSYIFLSDEGTTYQPSFINEEHNIIENLQVIGFSVGFDKKDAFKRLLLENNYLKTTTFSSIFCIEISNENGQDREYFQILHID